MVFLLSSILYRNLVQEEGYIWSQQLSSKWIQSYSVCFKQMFSLKKQVEVEDKAHRVLGTEFFQPLVKREQSTKSLMTTSGCRDGPTDVHLHLEILNCTQQFFFKVSDCLLMMSSSAPVWIKSLFNAGYSAVISGIFNVRGGTVLSAKLRTLAFYLFQNPLIPSTALSATICISWFVEVSLQTHFGFGLNLVSAFSLGSENELCSDKLLPVVWICFA